MIDEFLNQSATLKRKTFALTTNYGQTETLTTVGTVSVNCRQLTASESIRAGQLGIDATHRIVALRSSDVRANDELTIGGAVYRVQVINALTTTTPKTFADCVLIDAKLQNLTEA